MRSSTRVLFAASQEIPSVGKHVREGRFSRSQKSACRAMWGWGEVLATGEAARWLGDFSRIQVTTAGNSLPLFSAQGL